MNSTTLSTTAVTTPEPHPKRMREIMTRYPEVKKLFGPYPLSALYIVMIVVLQIVMAAWVPEYGFWVAIAAAFCIGAVANHAMFVMIHEATHNLVFRRSKANRWIGMVANLPLVFPAAMGFRNFHLLHHKHQGEMGWDADLAGPVEAKLVGNSALRKTLWFLFFWFIEGVVRPARLKHVKLMDRWVWTNLWVQMAFNAAVVLILGWGAFGYLALSTVFSIGLHPLGARWIQEHYIFKDGQETYSYYGPFNYLMFNVGYHNEHHDFVTINWTRLKELKRLAPDFYDTLYSHRSYWKLLFRFIFDRKMSLYSRVTRPDRGLATPTETAKVAMTVAPITQT